MKKIAMIKIHIVIHLLEGKVAAAKMKMMLKISNYKNYNKIK